MTISPPPSLTTTTPQKRPSHSQDQDRPAIKNRRREHHHRLQTPMKPNLLPDSALTDAAAVDTLLKLSIGMLLRDCGFSHADPVALDSFRSAVEECIHSPPPLLHSPIHVLLPPHAAHPPRFRTCPAQH
ncbi:hypothetical protein EMCG_07509 [[Emmonsia] crescens]|uniref:Uncharacterized protein n=1 Tax=[Emmonsia] crescens TaxID=73230 RepID=A0A0G2I982_9EURO|nr:hypothetical protein EMCG_07509 [Emmonsia crescens UAMH 3008]